MLRHDPGLSASPGVRYILIVPGSGTFHFAPPSAQDRTTSSHRSSRHNESEIAAARVRTRTFGMRLSPGRHRRPEFYDEFMRKLVRENPSMLAASERASGR